MICSYPIPDNYCEISFNNKLSQKIMSCPEKVRKQFRLLLKQYQVISITQEAPKLEFNSIIKEQPIIVKYMNDLGSFEWIIDINEF